MVSFRIRRQYFDKIVSGEKKAEIRSNTNFWRKRLFDPQPDVAVFVCGKEVHRRYITNVFIEHPETYLKRPLSNQGSKDIYTDLSIITELGEAMNDKTM